MPKAMQKFDVDVEGQTYEVDAPDADTAWAWANQTHAQAKEKAWRERTAATATLGNASGFKKFVLGAGSRASEMVEGVRGLFSDTPRSAEKQSTINIGQQMRDLSTPAAAGGFATDVAGFAAPGLGATGMLARGTAMLPRSIQTISQLGGNAALDAGLSAAYATEDRGQAAAEGAVGSLGGQVLGRTLSRLGGGAVTPSPEAGRLMERGVQPTIGQAANQETFSGRAIRRAEEAMQSLPFAGDMISRSRNRAVDEAMRGATQFSDNALAAYRNVPGVASLPANATGDELLKVVNSNASAVYSDALSRAGYLNVGRVPSVNGVDISQLAFAEAASRGVDDSAIQNFIKNTILPKVQNGTMDGDTWKRIDEMLGKNAAAFRASTDGDKRLVGDTYKQLQVFWRELLENKSSPEIKRQVAAANEAWAKMLPLEKAASVSSAARDGGVFTGGQLQRAVRDLDRSRFDRSSRYNPTELARYSNDAAKVLGNTLSNSGTVDRAVYGGLIGGGGYSMGVLPEVLAATAAAGTAYTRPAQKFMLGGYDWQRGLQDALRRRNANFGDIGAAFTTD